MATRQYKVIREVYDQSRFMSSLPAEYSGCRMYLVEQAGYSPYAPRTNQYMLSRESYTMGQSLMIDEDTEISQLRAGGSALMLNGNRVIAYRAQQMGLSSTFKIVAEVKDTKAVESFGKGIDIYSLYYRLYDAVREGQNGYGGVKVRLFLDARDAIYSKGMTVPVNETIALPIRTSNEPAHYLHDTSSKAYQDRVWRSMRRAAGAPS